MKRIIFLMCCIYSSFSVAVSEKSDFIDDKQLIPHKKILLGEEEWVKIGAMTQALNARVDTGATTSSISAIGITPFENNGEQWVKFRISHKNVLSAPMQHRIIRSARIIQSSKQGFQRRYVVSLNMQIGDQILPTEFTLTNREHLTYPVLLGRSYLRNNAIVDVSEKFVQKKPNE